MLRHHILLAAGLALVAVSATTVGCTPFQPDDHPTDALRWPVGIVADPDGKHLYVANSNFDRKYEGGNILVVDIDTHSFVDGVAVQTGSFGGPLTMVERDGKAAGLYTATRETNTVVFVEVNRDSQDRPTLNCAPDAAPAGELQNCAGAYVFGGADVSPGPGADPFGVAVAPATATTPARLYATSFEGRMTIFELDAGDAAYGVPAFQQQVNLDTGTYGLAVHPVTGAAYTTTKFGIGISKVTVAEAPLTSTGEAPTDPLEVTAERTLVVSNSTAGRDFGRGLAFNKDGTLAFAAYRTPPSLLVVDTSVDAAGQEADRLLDMIPLPDGPASVAVGNTGPNGRELVYITLFNADKVAVVDPALADVVALIDVGNAPFDLAIVERDDLKRAYVTLFEENAIGVIELDSTSSFYHQEIARIP